MQNYSALKHSLAGASGQDSLPAGRPSSARAAKWAAVIAITLLSALLLLSWLRLFFGVDFTDESFYVAMPYRFALGDVPLRDEQNLGQLAGVLILPFVRLYLQVMGGSDGIVLYVRHLHLIFTALVGIAVYLAVRPALGRGHALLAGALCLAFVPFNIHSLSYNTMGSGLLTVGCFLALHGGGGRARWGLAGLAHGLAILVYPTLAPVAVVFPAVLFATEERSRRKHLIGAYLAGGLLAAMIPAWLAFQAGFDAVRALPAYLAGFQTAGGGLDKVWAGIATFAHNVPQPGLLLAGMAVLAVWNLLRPRPLRWLLPLLPLLLLGWWREPNGTDNLLVISAVALLGPFVYPLVRDLAFGRRVMRYVWTPSFVAGLITLWSSTNGSYNACIGLFPACVASVVFMQMALMKIPVPAAREFAVLALPLLLLVPLMKGGYTDYYGDPVHRDKLTERVGAGPYKGLYTQPERAAMLRQFEQQVRPLIRSDDRALVFNDWTGGYLLLGSRPGTNSVWLAPGASRQTTFDYWQRSSNVPSIVLLMKKSESTPDPLLDLARGPAFQTVADLGFATLRRRLAPVSAEPPAAASPAPARKPAG